MFPMFQELAPHDKSGHHYAICLDLKNQRFEVLDSMRSEADADLTTHAEYFINNLKETWSRHYENSKVQIRHFPIEYVATTEQGNRYFPIFSSCVLQTNAHPLFLSPLNLSLWFFSICSCELTWLFSCLGTTAASTRWNTLQSGKVDGFLSSQLQWSSSSAKFTHGTGWWMKISTCGPTHVSS